MEIQFRSSSHIRTRSPDKHNRNEPPLKRRKRRRWCDIVESRALANGRENDSHRVAQRQKQIDYGKNTIAYDRFNAVCPREQRERGDPMTPLARQKCSKRSFAGQITSWKKLVYAYVAKLDHEENAKQVANRHIVSGVNDFPPQHKQVDLCEPGKVDAGVVLHSANLHNEKADEDFSDMDDIELDDFGNVVTDTPPSLAKDDHNTQEKNADDSPASIFDAF